MRSLLPLSKLSKLLFFFLEAKVLERIGVEATSSIGSVTKISTAFHPRRLLAGEPLEGPVFSITKLSKLSMHYPALQALQALGAS